MSYRSCSELHLSLYSSSHSQKEKQIQAVAQKNNAANVVYISPHNI